MLSLATSPRRNSRGEWISIELPRRLELFELASADFFERLRALTVADLEALRPTGHYVGLCDAMIALRRLLED